MYHASPSRACLRLLLPALWAMLIPVMHARADAEPREIDQARQQLMAGNNDDALATVQAYLKTATDKTDRDVATILESRILILAKKDGVDANEELISGAKPDNNPAVQAELLRLKAAQSSQAQPDNSTIADKRALRSAESHQDHFNELVAYQELLKTYPDQFSGYDLYNMTTLEIAVVKVNRVLNKFVKEVIDTEASRLGDSPLVAWSRALLKKSAGNDPVAGLALMRQAEKGLQEPLLSLAREKELYFLQGNADDHDRVGQAKAIAHEIIQANRIDIQGSFKNIMPMVRSRKEPDGMAKWLEAEAKTAPTPESAAVLWLASLNEYLDIGRGDEAQTLVAEAQAANLDPKTLRSMQGTLKKLLWQVEGQLPKSWLAPDRKWAIEAVESQMPGATGKLLASTSTTADASGHFSLTVSGPEMMAVVAYTHPANGMPVLHILAEELKPGTPISIDESKYVRHALPAPVTAPGTFILNERFGKDWQPQLVQLHLPKQTAVNPETLRVVDSHGESVPCQYLGNDDNSTIVGVWRGLKAHEQETLKVSFNDASIPVAAPPGTVKVSIEGAAQVVDTGTAQFKIPAGSTSGLTKDNAASYAFLLGAKGPDGVWRGKPDWVGNPAPTSVRLSRALNGPIRTSFVVEYQFANGAKRVVTLSFDAGQPVMLIDEKGEGDFPGEFQLNFVPGDGFDTYAGQWRPTHGVEPLVKRTPTLAFHLSDYPYFSTYLNAMLAGVLSSKPEMKDFFAAFVVHPGDWFDPSYKEAFTPTDEHPDEQWPNPYRYTGSMNSAISGKVVKNGALTYEIPLTPGTRRWAVTMLPHDTIKKGPGTWESEYLVDRYNQGDLSDYAKMILQWATPLDEHGPTRDMIHDRLLQLQATKGDGLYKAARNAVENEARVDDQWMMAMGIQDDEPGLIWLGWHQLSSQFDSYVQMSTGLQSAPGGLDPVACRNVPNMQTAYLIADELGMLTDEQRAHYRADAALTAYRLWSPDFMNWHMNCGQPNFEIDRLDQVLSFADTFPDHPAAKEMHDHVVRQLKEALRQYTIRDGGKWAENIGGYYLYSFELVTRIAMGLKLNGGLEDLISSPYFEPFCRFRMQIVMGRMPPDTAWLKEDNFTPIPMGQWVRYTPGIGSHGGDGGKRIDQYTLLMGQTIQQQNPKLANDLYALWKSGGNYFVPARPPEILLSGQPSVPEAPVFTPQPRRLPGFGLVMRDGVNTDREFCMTIHAGTTGYRDENANGGITLNALGRPLSLIGGEGTDASGRTNLVFDNKRGQDYSGVPRGTITRWLFSDAVEYARGDFAPPADIQPGATGRSANSMPASTDAPAGSEKPPAGAGSETQITSTPPASPESAGKAAGRKIKPPIKISRDILFARNDYVVFQDQHNETEQGYFNFATPASWIEQTPQGTLCHGKLGVDVWLIPLVKGNLPAAPDPPEDVSYAEFRATEANMWHQLSVKIPIEQFSDTLLYPVPEGGKPPKTELLGRNAWHISGSNFDDVLFTGNATQQIPGIGDVTFEGQMALLRRSGKGWSFSVANGTSVNIGGVEFTTCEPETIYYDGSGFREVTGDNQPAKLVRFPAPASK